MNPSMMESTIDFVEVEVKMEECRARTVEGGELSWIQNEEREKKWEN
jgi:hypothetical protein